MKHHLLLAFGLACSATLIACAKDQAPPAGEIDVGLDDTGSFEGGADVSVDGGKDSSTSDSTSDAPDATDAPVKAACPSEFPDTTAKVKVSYPGRASTSEQLAAITWDELTMAWTTNVASKVTLHYSDRAARDADFTTDQVLPDSLGPFGEDKVALSADGLTMLFVTADHKAIRQISRLSRGAAFDAGAVVTAPFARLVGPGSEGGPTKQVTDLVLSKDGKWLFYTDLLKTSGASMMLSIRLGDGTWDFPNPITEKSLAMNGVSRRRPSGFSADTWTLFYFDEVSSNSYAAFRSPLGAVFSSFTQLSPTGTRANPTESCDRIYLTVNEGGKVDGGVVNTPGIVHVP